VCESAGTFQGALAAAEKELWKNPRQGGWKECNGENVEREQVAQQQKGWCMQRDQSIHEGCHQPQQKAPRGRLSQCSSVIFVLLD